MRQEITPGGLYNSKHESKTPLGKAYSGTNFDTELGIWRGRPRYANLGSTSGSTNAFGMGYGRYAQNEVQTLTMTGNPTGGTVVLRYSGQDTAAIAYNATADTVQARLEALSNIGSTDVKCGGGPWPTQPITVTFQDALGLTDVAAISLQTNSLTGGSSPSVTIAETAKGGSFEEYVGIVKDVASNKAFKITTGGTFSAITGATGLAESDWFFAQYQNKIFAVNQTDGLRYKEIGTDAWRNGNKPPGSLAKPTITYGTLGGLYGYEHFLGSLPSSVAVTGGTGLTGTVYNNAFKVAMGGTAITEPTQIVVTVTLTGAQDWAYNDIWKLAFSQGSLVWGTGSGQVDIDELSVQYALINNDGSPVTINADYRSSTILVGSTKFYNYFQFADAQRESRDNVLKLKITLTVNRAPTSGELFFCTPTYGTSWMNDTLALNVDNGPVQNFIEYAYSYYDVSELSESDLSPPSVRWEVPFSVWGVWIPVNCTVSTNGSLTTSDYVYLYRKEKATGKWRRVGQVANSGSPQVIDKYMEHELANLAEYTGTNLSTAVKAEQIGVWKQCLVVAADRKAYISYQGQPLRFLPPPEEYTVTEADLEDATIGRTVYVSDNRSELVYGIHGQDSLFFVTPFAVYVMVGDTPQGATPPRRLPGSRGSVGYRASWGYGGGVLVGSEDGLWYYNVGRSQDGGSVGQLSEKEITADVRESWRSLLGSSYSNLIVTEFNDEIWAINGEDYLVLTRNNEWVSGSFTHSVYCVVPVRANGLRWLRATGEQDRWGRGSITGTDYIQDGADGLTTGTAVTWNWSSGIIDGPRARITGFEIQGSGYPELTVYVYPDPDVTANQSKTYGPFRRQGANLTWHVPLVLPPACRFKFKLAGTTGVDTVEALAFSVEKSNEDKNG